MASLQERKQMLLDDPDLSVVEPHRVFCNRCDKWLKLDETKLYAASVWRCHKNTKSHNMRAPNPTAPAPHLLKDGKIIGPTKQQSTEQLQFIIENPSSASAPAALPTMLSLGGNTMPQRVEPDQQSTNLSAQTVATFKYYRADAQSNEPHSPHHGQPQISQESMPPPPPPPAAQKPPLLPVARSNFLGSPVQSAGQPRAPSTPHHITRARSISAKDGVVPSTIMPTSRATALSLERLSPHRKASYKALMGERYIGELEPFRAFCTLCHRWVDLSSRTPYSYGVWKGHVRKTDKHNRLRIGNTEDGYDTTSDRSHEDSGAPAAPETARDNRRDLVKTPATKGHNETLKVSTAPPSKVEPTIHSTRNQNNNTYGPGSSAVENDLVQARNVALTPDLQSPIAPKLPAEANSSSAISKPVVLTTTIEDRVGRHNRLGLGDLLANGHDGNHMSVFASPRDIKQQSRRESPVHDAVDFRRRKLLEDPDILDADPRSVVCRRCQSRVELEGPDAYMIEKWLAHKDKCLGQTTQTGGAHDAARQHTNRVIKTHTTEIHRNAASRAIRPLPKGKGKAAGYRRAPSPITLPPLPLRPRWPGEDERKQQFIDDPDVQRIEPHRLLCKHCNCWIKLHPIIRYSQSVWPLHKTSCKDIQLVVPGDAKIRARSEKEDSRKQLLDDDAYATDVSPHRVTCKACGTNIRLDTTYKYEGSHWRAHRARCPRIPFQDRISKKRRISERRARDNLQTHPLDNPSQAQVTVTDSSDSDDSDAASAPRPRPTSFFTAPLEINITHMFKRRSRVIRPPKASVIAAAKAQAEADIAAHLQAVAADLATSDRLVTIIESAGDDVTSQNQLASAMQHIVATSRADDNTIQHQETVLSTHRSSPAPDQETWIPRKRTREEEMEFDYFFNKIPPSPTPPNELRLCDLGKQAMQVVD